MLPTVRRVVTGQTSDDRHVYTHVEEVEAIEMGGGAKWYPAWGWEELPTLPFSPTGAYQPRSVFPGPGGMRTNVVTFPAGFGVKGNQNPPVAPDPEYQRLLAVTSAGGEHDFDAGMHSTDSADLGFVFSGEITLIQGDGSEVTLRAGDVMIQNGAKHAWENRSDQPCMICFVVLGASRATASKPAA